MKVLCAIVRSTFWIYNVVFTALGLFGVLPFVLIPLVIDAITGFAPWELVGTTALLIAIPVFSLVHATRHEENRTTLALLSFMFGVELPLLATLCARLFGMGELTGAAAFLYSAIVVGGGVAEGRLVVGARLPKNQLIDGLCHALLTLRAAVGIYVGAVLATLTLPLLVSPLAQLDTAVERWPMYLLALLLMGWFLVSFAIVLVMPVLTPLAWVGAAVTSGRQVRAAHGEDDLFITSVGPVLVGVAMLVHLWPQPHTDALARLATPPATDEERRALVSDQDAIATGLVDAYLGKHRYPGDDLDRPWRDVLAPFLGNVEPAVDDTMRGIARPFFYELANDDRGDDHARRARELYRGFFGRELERDHAAEVRAALSARWERRQRYAGFIDEGQERVRLERQELSVTSQGGAVVVEVHDVWVNQTTDQQEVVLFFELPESAAVTALWLGDQDDRATAFTHVVSPRGAAQQLYREEVRARRDPALLEQIGPRQYRLRVFPVPPRSRVPGTETLSIGYADDVTPRVHVWLRYEALPDAAGRPPLPLLREHRNGFWDDGTARTIVVDGARSTITSTSAVDAGPWVQLDDASVGALPQVARRALQGTVHDGCVTMTPAPAPPPPSLVGKVVDVVVDRSLALSGRQAELHAAVARLRALGGRVRVTLGTSALRGENARGVDDDAAIDAALRDAVFFGAARPKELLGQLVSVRGAAGLGDVAIVLTAAGTYDVADDTPLTLPDAPPPLLIVHLTGALPAGYDDATLDAVRRSGGAFTTDLDDALARLAGGRARAHVDGYAVVHAAQPCTSSTESTSAITSRQRILLADRGGKADLSELDALHGLARSASVVTPYSSMIVLVDAAQRERLRALEQQEDRFQREVDDEAKAPAAQAPQTPPTVQGVPEPEEWLLIALCAGALIWAVRRRGLGWAPLTG